MPWLINEAAALKAKVSGLTVTDANAPSGRPVEVRFREPETELADMVYPTIMLEYTGLRRASEREHRSGPIHLNYIPEGQPTDNLLVQDPNSGEWVEWNEDSDFPGPYISNDYPIPYDLDFQITVMTRLQNHIMQLVPALARINYIPERFGFLQIPQDGTVRSLFLTGGPEFVASKDKMGKRIFEAIYTVRCATELMLYDVQTVTNYVNGINLTLDVIGVHEVLGRDDSGLTDSVTTLIS